MSVLDIFRQDPFTEIALTTFVERNPYLPSGIGSLDIFEDEPIYTRALAVEDRNGVLTLVPTSPRGSPATERVTEKRKARYFEVPRIKVGDTIQASELQSVRQAGTEAQLMDMQTEVARRVAGPTGLTSLIEYTWEYHRLAAVQGYLYDADGSVMFDWAAEFGVSRPAEVGFNLAANVASTLRGTCNTIVRGMKRAAKGAFIEGRTEVHAICGDAFYDAFTQHVDVVRTYQNWEAAKDLRSAVGAPFGDFPYGGIIWHNYRGSDDNSTIAVPSDKAKFFLKNAPGVFKRAWAPGEAAQWVNTRGKPMYAQPIFDLQRNEWWRVEVSSYPLHICTRPETLYSGRSEA